MRKLFAIVVIGFAALSVGAAQRLVAASEGTTFRAHLAGKNEVPPVQTPLTGNARFHLTDNDQVLAFRLTLHDTSQLLVAHIHLAPKGQNGPIVAFLFGPLPAPGLTNETVRVEGFLTDANLTGPLTGKSIADLVAAMKSGGAYVNAHTVDHPAGASRGQITVSVDDNQNSD